MLVTLSEPLSTTSHDQPEPKRFTPASVSCFFSSSKLPKAELIASPSSPPGVPPPFDESTVQNSEWLAWPPALLRTGPCLSAASDDRCASTSSTGLSAHSVPSSAALALSTYAWWCLSWWMRIVCSSMCGSSALYAYGRSGTSYAMRFSLPEWFFVLSIPSG